MSLQDQGARMKHYKVMEKDLAVATFYFGNPTTMGVLLSAG